MKRLSEYILPFRSRALDFSRPVRAYRNLHRTTADGRPVYSVVQDGRVVAHSELLVFIGNASLVVSRAGRARARKLGHKTVHAFVEGRLARGTRRYDPAYVMQPVRLRYDFRTDEGFVVTKHDGEKISTNADYAFGLILRRDGAVACVAGSMRRGE